MAYLEDEDLPTVDDFRTRFPEFTEDVASDAQVTQAIADAALTVDDTWLERDIEPALLHLAAHYLAAGQTAAEQVEDGGPPIKSETIGRISTTYGDPASAINYKSTSYGAMFQSILNRNRNHVAVI